MPRLGRGERWVMKSDLVGPSEPRKGMHINGQMARYKALFCRWVWTSLAVDTIRLLI